MELETVTVLATSLEYVTYTRDAIDAIDELKQSLDSGKAVRTITIKRTIFLSRFIKPLPANLTYTTLDRIDERLKELGYNI